MLITIIASSFGGGSVKSSQLRGARPQGPGSPAGHRRKILRAIAELDGVAPDYWPITHEAGYHVLDQDRAWERYAAIFEEWNRDLMVNILSLEQHYHRYGKREQFENVILPAFTTIHKCLEGLRRPTTTIDCEISKTRDINVINKALERLNQDLYYFVFGLPDPKQEDPKTRCFGG
jgi:hypothetical protein